MSRSNSPDALRLVGTLVLLARSIDQESRSSSRQELDLNDLFVLRTIEVGYHLPSQIARRLRLDPPRITRIVDALVKREYVTRSDDPEDRRRCRLQITQLGKRDLDKGLESLSDAAKRLLDQLEPRESIELVGGLEAARRVLDASAEI